MNVGDYNAIRAAVVLAAVFVLATCGCGVREVRSVTGGTKGSLRTGANPVAEMQVAVFQKEGSAWQQIGFGTTRSDGSFELVQNKAAGPLVLTPGAYRCTLESAGAPVTFPRAYTQAKTSPLAITWPTANERLDLTAPIKLAP